MNVLKPTSRTSIFLAVLMIFIIVLPALTGTGLVGLTEDDDFPDDDNFLVISHFPVARMGIAVHQLSILLKLGISIYALFVVYLGGRSKAKRFNDRTIDRVKSLIGVFAETALTLRAVFNFLFSDPFLQQTNSKLSNGFVPIQNPFLKEVLTHDAFDC